ncbi:hypothetical protein GGF31_007573 [Allomyces arbusculus]|nr:hypothetical protein GGF31_007573 [Allomyces arbusculus]
MGFTLRRSPSEDRRLRANAAAAARSTANGTHRLSRHRQSAVSPLPRDTSKHSLNPADDEDNDDESSIASSTSSPWSASSSSSSAAFPANVTLRAALQSASAMQQFPALPAWTSPSVEHTVDSDEANLGTEARIVRRLTRRYVEAMAADPAPAMPPPPRASTGISQESARDLLSRTRAAARRLRESDPPSDDSDSSVDIDRVPPPPQPQYVARAPASASTAPFWSLVVRLDGMLGAESVHQTHPASPVTFSRDAHQPDWQTPRGLIADGIVPVTDRMRMLPSPAGSGPGEDATTARGARQVAGNAAGTDVQQQLQQHMV